MNSELIRIPFLALILSTTLTSALPCLSSTFDLDQNHFDWNRGLAALGVRGFNLVGEHVYAAVPASQGNQVTEFFDLEEVPLFLKTAQYMSLKVSFFELLDKINRQNKPYRSEENLHWMDVSRQLPKRLIEFMYTQFDDGTNCFRTTLIFANITDETGFLSDTSFQDYVKHFLTEARYDDADIGVIYRNGLPLHAFIPIGTTGWAVTKNGVGKLQSLRFERVFDIIGYYRSVENYFGSGEKKIKSETDSQSPMAVVYFKKN